MNYSFKWRIRNDSLVKSSRLCNILHDGEVKFVSWYVGVSLLDLVRLLLGSNSRHNRMAMLQEEIQNVGGNEATATLCNN